MLQRNIASLKLPVWQTVGACYAFVGSHAKQLLRISWLPLLILLLVSALTNWLVSPWLLPAGERPVGFAAQLLRFLSGAIQLPFLASIAVAWHRLVLRQEAIETWFYLRFDSVVWQYTSICFLLNLASLAPVGNPKTAALATLTSFVILFFILPRVSLMLPAIALERDLPLTEAWRATRANTWRLGLAMMLCVFPPLLLVGAAIVLAERTLNIPKLFVASAACALVALGMTVSVTLLSFAFDLFIRQRDPGKFMPKNFMPA